MTATTGHSLATVEEVVALKGRHVEDARVRVGGTNLFLLKERRGLRIGRCIDFSGNTELTCILEPDGAEIRSGAMASLAELERHACGAGAYKVLWHRSDDSRMSVNAGQGNSARSRHQAERFCVGRTPYRRRRVQFAGELREKRRPVPDLLSEVRYRHRITVVMVKHDVDDAIFLAGRFVFRRLRPGRIREIIMRHSRRGIQIPHTEFLVEHEGSRRLQGRIIKNMREPG